MMLVPELLDRSDLLQWCCISKRQDITLDKVSASLHHELGSATSRCLQQLRQARHPRTSFICCFWLFFRSAAFLSGSPLNPPFFAFVASSHSCTFAFPPRALIPVGECAHRCCALLSYGIGGDLDNAVPLPVAIKSAPSRPADNSYSSPEYPSATSP